jgi:hypothetical protein
VAGDQVERDHSESGEAGHRQPGEGRVGPERTREGADLAGPDPPVARHRACAPRPLVGDRVRDPRPQGDHQHHHPETGYGEHRKRRQVVGAGCGQHARDDQRAQKRTDLVESLVYREPLSPSRHRSCM